MEDFSKKVTLKNGQSVTIRLPVAEDVDNLLVFVNDLIKENTYVLINTLLTRGEEVEYLAKCFADIASGNMIKLLVVAEDGKILGASDVIRLSYKQAHIGRLNIALAKEMRGLGLGRALLEEALQLAKVHLKLDMVQLECFANNKAGLALYKKLGFVKYGVLPQAILDRDEKVDEVCMYKML